MGIEIKIFHENADGAMIELKRIAEAMGVTFMASQGAPAKPPKLAKGGKDFMDQKPASAPAEDQASAELPPVIQVDPAKAPEKVVDATDEAACRAAAQHLHSTVAGKSDAKGGIKALKDILDSFQVKKISELKPEQWVPFKVAVDAAVLEVQKQ